MSRTDPEEKSSTLEFLRALHVELNETLPAPQKMRESVQNIIAQALVDDSKKHLKLPEWVFINHYALPIVSSGMQKFCGVGAIAAKQALLCEFWGSGEVQNYSMQTASRTTQSPFIKKYLEREGTELLNAWKEGKVERACPDFAFGAPFPFKVVFEGKYFAGDSKEKAASALVTCIREAFFYKCFPYAPARGRKPEWDYNFSCAFVCDASEAGLLESTWNEIPENVKSAFWEGADLYVMIMRGRAN